MNKQSYCYFSSWISILHWMNFLLLFSLLLEFRSRSSELSQSLSGHILVLLDCNCLLHKCWLRLLWWDHLDSEILLLLGCRLAEITNEFGSSVHNTRISRIKLRFECLSPQVSARVIQLLSDDGLVAGHCTRPWLMTKDNLRWFQNVNRRRKDEIFLLARSIDQWLLFLLMRRLLGAAELILLLD